ncbi:MAG: hypothetical protein ABGY09_01845 [Euryarchaeota archaeon]
MVEFEDLVRATECAYLISIARLLGRRGAALRNVMGRVLAEALKDRVPDDPDRALRAVFDPVAEIEVEGDRVRVRDCRMCACFLLFDVATEEELEVIREMRPCPMLNLFNQISRAKGWDVRLVPERMPIRGDTRPGTCILRIERG